MNCIIVFQQKQINVQAFPMHLKKNNVQAFPMHLKKIVIINREVCACIKLNKSRIIHKLCQ